MNKRIILFLLFFSLLQVGIADNVNVTEAVVQGRVINGKSKENLPFVHISIKGTTIETTTDAAGCYHLKNLPIGNLTLEVKLLGYHIQRQKIKTRPHEVQELDFELSEDAFDLDEVVLTANRVQTLRREAPALVNVLDKKTFEVTNIACLAQGLNFQPGVRTETNCQNCGFSQVRMNGLDGHYSQILIDSRPVFSALNGVYGLEQLPTNMIDRVEIVRGGGSSLYGASAVGGTINIITKYPTYNTGSFSHTITSLYGRSSYDNTTTANASLVTPDGRAGLSIFGQYHYRPGFDYDGDKYTELPNLRNSMFGFSSFIKLTPYSKLSMRYNNISEFRRGGNNLHLPPHKANITEQIEHSINGGDLTYDLDTSNLLHHLKAYFSFTTTNRKSYYGGIASGSTEDIETAAKAYGRTTDFTYIVGAQYSYYFDKLWFLPATLTLGGEYNYDNLNDEIIDYNHFLHQQIHIGSFFAQNEWKDERWSFVLGARMDKHNLISNPIFSPRVNLRYNPNEKVNLRFSYGQGFRAPQTFDEDLHVGYVGGERVVTINAPGLKVERSHSFSLSADLAYNLGKIQTDLIIEGFYTRLNNVFGLRLLNRTDDQGNAIQERYNALGANVMGVNIEGRALLTKWLTVEAGITLQQSRYCEPVEWNEDAAPVRKMLRTPNAYGYFTAKITPIKRLAFLLSGNYTGNMLVGHSGGDKITKPIAVETPRFMVINAKASYDIALPGSLTLQLNAGVQNLSNAYQKDFDQGWNRDSAYIYGPGLPRTFFLGAKFEF